jgi:dihydrodiol dehydrogenase / D-xylose 1-dehydrogenase (NADP)
MDKIIRWGIVGTGTIANKFAKTLANVKGAELVAVSSRTTEKAEKFAQTYHIPKAYGSHDAMAKDSEIDAVYISTLHPFHCEHSMIFLNAKKAVLCEKPVTMNATEVEKLVRIARENNVFFMEAMWTRFLPVTRKIMEIVVSGEIGVVKMLNSRFCSYVEYDPTHHLFAKELGGGALLDIGIYNLSYASMLLGTAPIEIKSIAQLCENGVDEQTVITLKYQDGQLATMLCSIAVDTPNDAMICGTEGYLVVQDFFCAKSFSLHKKSGEIIVYDLPPIGDGFEEEIIEVMTCMKQHRIESDIMLHNDSIAIMQIIDCIKTQIGLEYGMCL